MVDILSIGASGLTAYRKLLETVGGNITNASTEGYVRRDVQMSTTGEAAMLPTAAQSGTGSGVIVETVRRASDYFLQSQALNANSLNQQMQTLADALTRLEKSLFVTENNPGAVVQEFYARFSDVSGSPTSASSRMAAVDSGMRVSQVFAQTSGALTETLTSIRTGLDAALNQVNALTTQIARLNVDIVSSTSSGQKPNDLLDQRDKLLTSLSDLVGFTYVEQNTGAITIYLGDTASGRTLIGAEGAHNLGVADNNGRLDIVLDTYTSPAPTNQLRNGTIAGLMDFRSETLNVLENINRLAVGFSVAVNNQHKQGVDQNGDPGKDLFSTDGLSAKSGPLNKGDAKLSIFITDAASLGDVHYSARYNATTERWTVTSSDGTSKTGTGKVSIDGIDFSFDGRGVDGDIFNVDPLLGAAASMRFLIKTPAEIAAALPLYVDPDAQNIGLAEITPLKRTTQDPISPIPPARSLFEGANVVADFRQDGSAFMLEPNQGPVTLTSLASLSAVHFTVNASDIVAVAKPITVSGPAGLEFSLHVDEASDDKLFSFQLDPTVFDLSQVAAQINNEARSAGYQNSLFASVIDGTLTINALGAHTVSSGAFTGPAGSSKAVKGLDEVGASPTQMRIFTREGRQLFGPEMDETEAKTYLTSVNGFLPDAVYTYVPSNYPGAVIVPGSQLLQVTGNASNATIDVNAFPQFNMAHSSAQAGDDTGGNPLPPSSGAVYALNVEGLDPVRLAGDELSGKDAQEIASALADKMNAQASQFSWRGPVISLDQKTTRSFTFDVTIDEVAHKVVFRRAEDPTTGDLFDTGSFDVGDTGDLNVNLSSVGSSLSGSVNFTYTSPISVTMSDFDLLTRQEVQHSLNINSSSGSDGDISWSMVGNKLTFSSPRAGLSLKSVTTVGKDSLSLGFTSADLENSVELSRVLISVPKTLRSTAPLISITKPIDTATADFDNVFGSAPRSLTSMVTAAGDLTSSLLAYQPRSLSVKLASGAQIVDLNIDRPTGFVSGVSWTTVDGKIQLSSNDATMELQAGTDAQSLGFNVLPATGKLITASMRVDESALATAPVTLHVIDDSSPVSDHLVVINGTSGTSGGISWSYNGKTLSLLSEKMGLRVSAQTSADSMSAQALGFKGSDLDLEVLGNRLTLTSTVGDSISTGALADPSASVSRAASGLGLPNNRGYGSLTFNNGVPEDLIVAVVNNDDPALRRIAANIAPPPPDGMNHPPPLPDIRIKILSDGKLEILDPASSVSLAFRNWEQDKPVYYRGLSFTIHGTAVANDIYDIRQDPTRTADNRNALLISTLASKSIFGKTGGSFQDVYSNVTAKLGTTVNSAQMTAAGAAQQASDLKTAFESKTGVNLDSEASDLIRYQQAYSAAAQVVMAARDMFATILRSF